MDQMQETTSKVKGALMALVRSGASESNSMLRWTGNIGEVVDLQATKVAPIAIEAVHKEGGCVAGWWESTRLADPL